MPQVEVNGPADLLPGRQALRGSRRGRLMIRRWIYLLVALAAMVAAPRPAQAVFHAGDIAPDFRKTGLDGISRTLYQYRGKVVVLFLLGNT